MKKKNKNKQSQEKQIEQDRQYKEKFSFWPKEDKMEMIDDKLYVRRILKMDESTVNQQIKDIEKDIIENYGLMEKLTVVFTEYDLRSLEIFDKAVLNMVCELKRKEVEVEDD